MVRDLAVRKRHSERVDYWSTLRWITQFMILREFRRYPKKGKRARGGYQCFDFEWSRRSFGRGGLSYEPTGSRRVLFGARWLGQPSPIG